LPAGTRLDVRFVCDNSADVLGERQRLAIQKGIADGTLKHMQTRRQSSGQ
jgi:hypothetical protein